MNVTLEFALFDWIFIFDVLRVNTLAGNFSALILNDMHAFLRICCSSVRSSERLFAHANSIKDYLQFPYSVCDEASAMKRCSQARKK